MAEYSLELVNINKQYGKVTALKDINLRVREGEFFFLLGPSGCGKTTLLKIIAGLEDATTGTVRIMGADVTSLRANKRSTATVFQEWALFPHMSVYDNIAFGLRMQKASKAEIETKVRALLELIRLPDLARRKPYELSGGQQQRVAIARALATEPDILLLDEPLSNLDLALRQRMRIELKSLHEQIGKTFVYVTHDQIEALTMADRMVVMARGEISQLGAPRDLYKHPANDYVAKFLGEANEFNGKLRATGPTPIFETDSGFQLEVDVRDPALGEGSPACVILRPEHIRVQAAMKDKPLENVFDVIIDDIIYLGSILRYYCHTDPGDESIFFHLIADTRLGTEIKKGDRVTIGSRRRFTLCYGVD